MADALADWAVGEAAAAFPAREDIATNGAFAADTDWTKGTGATISAGVLSYDGTQVSASQTTQTPATALITSRGITVRFTITAYTAGAIRMVAGNDASPWFSATGTYYATLYPTSGTDIGVEADVDFIGLVDDLEVLQWQGQYGLHTHYQDVWLSLEHKPTRSYQFKENGTIDAAVDARLVTFDDAAGFTISNPMQTWDADTDLSGTSMPFTGSGTAVIADTQHQDYHFRIWVIPTSLNLSNPTVGADIPFRIWNTFPTTQTLVSTAVSGSSVLSFDIVDGVTTLRDQQYREVNMQIAAGEPTIEATVLFTFTSGSGTLSVVAVVSETFNILPEVPVRETWNYKTDVIRAYDSTEKRLSLMPYPRMEQNLKVTVVDFAERRQLYQLTQANIQVPSLVPLFQYAAPVTADTLIGSNRYYFDPKLTNLRVGGYMMAMNRFTREIVLGRVTTLYADGCETQSTTGVDVSAPLWFVAPAITSRLEDNSGLDFGTQAGTYTVRASALEFPTLSRPGSAASITTYDSLPVLEFPFLITTPERWTFERETLDGGVGAVTFKSASTAPVMNRGLKFSLQRDPGDDFDYFRDFIDGVRGAHKPFLITTRLPDFTLRNPATQAAAVLDVNENYYPAKFETYDAYSRIEVLYANGDNSYHNIIATVTDVNNDVSLSISPTLVDDPDYVDIDRISFLHRVRGSDRIDLEHFNDYSYLKWNVRTVND